MQQIRGAFCKQDEEGCLNNEELRKVVSTNDLLLNHIPAGRVVSENSLSKCVTSTRQMQRIHLFLQLQDPKSFQLSKPNMVDSPKAKEVLSPTPSGPKKFNDLVLKLSIESFGLIEANVPVVPHKAVAEVSRIGHYRRGELLWCMDGRANPLMKRKGNCVSWSGCTSCSGHLTHTCWM